jgi:hypothetical protein
LCGYIEALFIGGDRPRLTSPFVLDRDRGVRYYRPGRVGDRPYNPGYIALPFKQGKQDRAQECTTQHLDSHSLPNLADAALQIDKQIVKDAHKTVARGGLATARVYPAVRTVFPLN